MRNNRTLIEKYPLPWTQEKVAKFRKVLLAWYDQYHRNLPWRQDKDPYKIWVSEIMLQQTQVETVKSYYNNFITELPDVSALASVSQDELMNLWQGLGYYSRARNMKIAAQQILDEFDGVFPQTKDTLLTLKGIGPYTAGAIASMAFDQIEPAIDGNLTRIITRLFDIDEDVQKATTKRQIEAYLYQMIDTNRPGDFNQALMDIGATIMTASNPYPDNHPLLEFDLSFFNHTSQFRPVKKKKVKASHHQMIAYVIRNPEGQWLMRKHQEKELLTGLWHFPIVEQDMVMESATPGELIEPLLKKYSNLIPEKDWQTMRVRSRYQNISENSELKHIFSHRVWHIHKVYIDVKKNIVIDDDEAIWVSQNMLETLPLSTLQVKLMKDI